MILAWPHPLNHMACVRHETWTFLYVFFSANLIITISFWYHNLCVYHSSITWILYCLLCCQIDKISPLMSFSLKITISEVTWGRYDVITPSRDLRNVWHNCSNFSRVSRAQQWVSRVLFQFWTGKLPLCHKLSLFVSILIILPGKWALWRHN